MKRILASVLCAACLVMLSHALLALGTPPKPTEPPSKPRPVEQRPTTDIAVTSFGAMPPRVILGRTQALGFYATVANLGHNDAPLVRTVLRFSEPLSVTDIVLSTGEECALPPRPVRTIVCTFQLVKSDDPAGVGIVMWTDVSHQTAPHAIDASVMVTITGKQVAESFNEREDNERQVEVPVCTLISCDSEGKECGYIPDGCGGQLDCGDCASGSVCENDNLCHQADGKRQRVPLDRILLR
jgi:hypothetical protein